MPGTPWSIAHGSLGMAREGLGKGQLRRDCNKRDRKISEKHKLELTPD